MIQLIRDIVSGDNIFEKILIYMGLGLITIIILTVFVLTITYPVFVLGMILVLFGICALGWGLSKLIVGF